MALHDKKVTRWFATGIAGLSVVADSLSAIKYAKVKTVRDENGIVVDYIVEGDFPKYGNNDDRVDQLASDLVHTFMNYVKGNHTYRGGIPTTSILTITSNVVYGKNTGATPDGRKAGEAFAPGANPMHGRDKNGAIASLSSVAKLRYRDSQDGISNTFSIVPKSLGPTPEERVENLVTMMDGYFTKGAHHLNVNVLNREMLEDAMERSEYTAIVRDKLLRCPMLVVCSRNQDATTNAQIGLAQKYNRIVTTLDGLKKAVSEGDDLVS